jgi:hypothetical protein
MQSYIHDYITEFEQRLSQPDVTPAQCRWCETHADWSAYIDLPSFVDYMIVQELGRNVDGYRLSTFMYKQAQSDGGLLAMGPMWDLNLAFDNADCASQQHARVTWLAEHVYCISLQVSFYCSTSANQVATCLLFVHRWRDR